MPTVAELDVKINADDDATATILALDALIKSLDSDDVDIDIDTNSAEVQARIRALLIQLQRLDRSDPDIDIDVNGVGGASAELARLRAELDSMRDETIRIRANDSEVRRARTSMNEFRNSATQASRSVSAVAAAVIGLGAALIPIGAVAVGGIMGLVSVLAVAGIGTALFGAVAISTFSGVRESLKLLASAQEDYNKATTDEERNAALAKTKAIMEGLDPATRAMVQSVLDFKTAWRAFATQFQPQVFQIAQEGLRGITSILPSLAPIVAGTAGAFLSLERSAIRALQGPFWQSFFTMMGANVAPIMNQLGRSIGNLIEGFAAIIMAFMPMTRDFSGGMLAMTRSFSTWAKGLENNQGFQNFVAYIRSQTPSVLALIGALTLALIAIGKAAAPIGHALVEMVTGLSMAIVAFQEAHPRAATLVLALIAILAVTVKLLGPVLQIGRLFMVLGAAIMTLATPLAAVAGFFGIMTATLLAIIAVLAAVVVGVIYAYRNFEGFRNVVNNLASAFVSFAQQAYAAIVSGLGAAVSWLQATFGPAVAVVMTFVREQFDRIMAWVRENGPMFQEAWQNIVTFLQAAMQLIGMSIAANLAIIQAIWTAVWPTLLSIVKGIWEMIKGVISGALSIIMGIVTLWGAIFAGDWSGIWRGIVLILQGIWQIIWGFIKGAFIILQALVDVGMAVVKAVFKAGWDLVVAGLLSAWTTIKSIVSAGWNALKAVTSAAMNGIQNTINAAWAAVWRGIQAVLSLIVAGLASAWRTATSIVSSAGNAIRSAATSAFNAVRNAASSAMSALLSAVRSRASGAVQAIRDLGSRALAYLNGLPGQFASAGASMMASLAQGIRNGIGNAVGAVREAVSSITDLLPGSPAKTGPLSGQGYALVRGQHLSEDLAAGMVSRAGLIGSAARDIASMMAIDGSGALGAISRGTSPGSTGTSAGGYTITIAPGAVAVSVGSGASVAEASEAFDRAGDDLAAKLLTAIRRQ